MTRFSKLLFSFLVATSSSFVQATAPLDSLKQQYDYFGCGASKKEALSDLSLAAVSKIDVQASQERQVYTLLGFEISSGRDTLKQQVSSTLNIADAYIQDVNGQVCAFINKDQLLKTASASYQRANAYTRRYLPKQVRPRIKELDQWLLSLKQLYSFGLVFPDEFPNGWQRKLQRQIKQLQDERSRLHPQMVQIQVNNKSSQVYLAGRKIDSGAEHYLPVGEYEYRVKTRGYCEVVDTIDLEENSDEIIQIDIDDYRYPILQFNSNKARRSNLVVDGKRRKFGESFSVPRCDGEIAAIASFEGKSESRTYTLQAGEEIEDSFRFYSASELRDLQQLADQFSSGSRLEIKYGYSFLSDEVEEQAGSEFDGLHQTKINYLFMNKWLRHGPGVMIAQARGKYSGDIVYNLGAQLTNIGKGQPFHVLGKVAFVPFINMQLGLGYHEYVSEDQQTFVHNFVEDTDDDDESFARDFLVARLGGGLDISLSRWVGIQLFVDQSLTQEKTTMAGAGLTFKMP